MVYEVFRIQTVLTPVPIPIIETTSKSLSLSLSLWSYATVYNMIGVK
jgi:hypothetical protein